MEQVKVACPCPGTPHEEDTVGLRPKLGLVGGTIVQGVVVAAKKAADEAGGPLDVAVTTALVSEAYLLQGVAEWSFVDQLGKPVPVTAETIRSILLDDFTLASQVSEKADELYMESVIRPLLVPASTSLPPTPINASTSAPNGNTPKRPRRSRRSSTTTTPTDDTETTTTSPAGGSSSSRSEALAAV